MPGLLLLFLGLCSLFLAQVLGLFILVLPPRHLFLGLLFALDLFLSFRKAVLTTSCHYTALPSRGVADAVEANGWVSEVGWFDLKLMSQKVLVFGNEPCLTYLLES